MKNKGKTSLVLMLFKSTASSYFLAWIMGSHTGLNFILTYTDETLDSVKSLPPSILQDRASVLSLVVVAHPAQLPIE